MNASHNYKQCRKAADIAISTVKLCDTECVIHWHFLCKFSTELQDLQQITLCENIAKHCDLYQAELEERKLGKYNVLP